MKRFRLFREKDVSGFSGVGIICDGIQFSSGRCIIEWIVGISSLNIFNSLEELMTVHGHQGATVIQWIDTTN